MDIAHILNIWYNLNQRELPWRKSYEPYNIWVSEIILQQTQVKQGLPYYLKFIQKFPTINDLANANIDEVLHLWQGLGYYSRARNMHFAAQQIINEFNGEFPNTYNQLIKLKGIGEYTAAAIVSFCFNEAVAAIDGNVYRVITRLFNIDTPIDTSKGKNEVKEIANNIISKNNPGDFNQAIMDFGATICKPQSPLCEDCPLQLKCLAYSNKTFKNRPVKSKKIKKRTRYFIYLYIIDKENTLIEKSSDKDIWEGLYRLPLIESTKRIQIKDLLTNQKFQNLVPEHISIKLINGKDHILSHQIIKSTFVICTVSKLKPTLQTQMVKVNDLSKYAFPVLLNNFFNDIL